MSDALDSTVSERELLEVRLCDLPVGLSDGPLQRGIDRLGDELAAKGIRFRPHFWLADQWFSPDGVPGVALPYYLAHPRLKRMERKHVGTIDGGTFSDVMKLLRHETAHALDHAYRLHRRKRWQRLFGKSSQPCQKAYKPDPFDRRYVVHLDEWYAQSHPDEDFAETFAVWLAPRSNWRRRYAGWPALEKLAYVDELMNEVADAKPKVTTRIRPYLLSQDRRTLKRHYAHRRSEGVYRGPQHYDDDLKALFGDTGKGAAALIRRHRAALLGMTEPSWGPWRYNFEQVINEFTIRCRVLGLRTKRSWPRLRRDLAALLTKHALAPEQQGLRVIPT